MLKSVIILIVISMVSFVQMSHATELWTGQKNIKAIQVVSNGGFLIFFNSEVNSACTAAGTDSVYIYPGQVWSVTTEGVQALLAIALSAYHSGDKVTVSYDDGSPNCWSRQIYISK